MTIEVMQEAVRAICSQQNGGVCKCMTEGGVGLGKVPAAVMCRDTYLEIWQALEPMFTRHRIEAQRPLIKALERLMDSIMERTKGDYAGSWDNALAAIKQAKGG